MSDLIIPDGPQIGPDTVGQGNRPADLGVDPAPVIQEPKSEDELPQWARDAISKANKEAADYRGKLRGYEAAFDGMDADTQDGWLAYIQTANAANAGDAAAIETLREAGLWEEPTAAAPEGEAMFSPDEIESRILQQVDARLQERDARQAESANIGYLHSEAQKLGYEVGSTDYDFLVTVANRIDPRDLPEGQTVLTAANQQVQDWKRQQYDQFMASKSQDARQNLTLPSSTGGQPNLPAETAKTHMELRERVAQRINQGG